MHTQCMKPPDVYAQHSVLIVPTMLMSLAGNGVLANVDLSFSNLDALLLSWCVVLHSCCA